MQNAKIGGCQFTDIKPRGIPPILRKLGVLLYAHFGVSMSCAYVADFFKVFPQTVEKWIKKASDEVLQTPKLKDYKLAEVDALLHFINEKKTKF